MNYISPVYLRLILQQRNYKTLAVTSSIPGGWLVKRKGL